MREQMEMNGKLPTSAILLLGKRPDTQNGFDVLEVDKPLVPVVIQTPDHPARSLVSILTAIPAHAVVCYKS